MRLLLSLLLFSVVACSADKRAEVRAAVHAIKTDVVEVVKECRADPACQEGLAKLKRELVK